MVSSFGITAIESRKSKEINLYSDYTKIKLQAFTVVAITSIRISLQHWDLAYTAFTLAAGHGMVCFWYAFTLARIELDWISPYSAREHT